MTHLPDNQAARLLAFNSRLLEQALALAAAHEAADAPPYAQPVGAHLRHVIEHHEALLLPRAAGVVDYDGRPRDRELEHYPALARRRLLALQQALARCRDDTLDAPLRVRGQAGLAGEFAFEVGSTFGRELAFVASHAVHHYALLTAHCRQHGIAVDADFGRAPATVAHDRALRASTLSRKEVPCQVPLAAA